jgi:alkanesulfonate monooxygenase SsuD/methylene tetrahydromethanopterin reductase-like flavin-dependent oxidoreductase (luciferase family)
VTLSVAGFTPSGGDPGPVVFVSGVGFNAKSAVRFGDVAAMVDLVDETMARTLAVVGTPEECAAEIRRRFEDVADRVCAYFPGYDAPLAQVTALATALRAPG